jgi:DNA-binding SARP family transcriptional activator
LAFLLLNPDIGHSREKLVDLLWPDISSDKGRGRLSTALWRIRVLFKTLEIPTDGILESTTESVALYSDTNLRVDVNLFQDYVVAAERASGSKEKETSLVAAAEIYRADLLEGIYTDWCLIERERLARIRLQALGQLMACYIDLGAIEKADMRQPATQGTWNFPLTRNHPNLPGYHRHRNQGVFRFAV